MDTYRRMRVAGRATMGSQMVSVTEDRVRDVADDDDHMARVITLLDFAFKFFPTCARLPRQLQENVARVPSSTNKRFREIDMGGGETKTKRVRVIHFNPDVMEPEVRAR